MTCPSLGWLMRQKPNVLSIPQTLGKRFRRERGREIEKRARKLYPRGVLVDTTDPVSGSEKTMSLMNNPNVTAIFQGSFLHNQFSTRADVLIRRKNGWHLIEVKSGVNDTPKLIDDLAYTALIIKRSGIPLSGYSLLLLSRNFRLGLSNKYLFNEIDHTDDVRAKVQTFESYCDNVDQITSASEKPEPILTLDCKQCQFFEDCLGKDIVHPIFEIPRMNQRKFSELAGMNCLCVQDIPKSFQLTDKQKIVHSCIQSNQVFVGENLANELSNISWPTFFVDFETVSTAIPLYNNIAPYEHIPTQFSIFKCSKVGVVDEHYQYLADPSRDCRRDFSEKLIHRLGDRGSIIVYGSFEKTQIRRLINVFPDLSVKLSPLIDRLFDLQKIVENSFCHPDFHGRTSLKKVIPVLAPDVSYEALAIKEGDSALATFALIATGSFSYEEREIKKRQLLEYCRQDTLAEVKLLEKLFEISD